MRFFNRRLKDAELGKLISDVRNNVPTGKVFAELILKKIVYKCCLIIVQICQSINYGEERNQYSSLSNQEVVEHNYQLEHEEYLC